MVQSAKELHAIFFTRDTVKFKLETSKEVSLIYCLVNLSTFCLVVPYKGVPKLPYNEYCMYFFNFTFTPSAAGRAGFAAATAAMDLLPTALSAAERDNDISAAAVKITITAGECQAESRQYGRTAEGSRKMATSSFYVMKFI